MGAKNEDGPGVPSRGVQSFNSEIVLDTRVFNFEDCQTLRITYLVSFFDVCILGAIEDLSESPLVGCHEQVRYLLSFCRQYRHQLTSYLESYSSVFPNEIKAIISKDILQPE